MDVARELDEICDFCRGNVNVSLQLLADGSFEINYGDYLHDGGFHGKARTIEEAITLLRNVVRSQRFPRLAS
jgi:hypothetical protein